MASFRLSFSSSPTQNTPIPLYLSQKAASAHLTYPTGAPHDHVPTVQTLRPVFEVKAQNNGGVSRYTSWARVQGGGRGSCPQNRGISTFPTRPFLAKRPEKPRKGIEIDYQSTSTEDRRGSDSFGATLDPRDWLHRRQITRPLSRVFLPPQRTGRM